MQPDAPSLILKRCRSAYGEVPTFLDYSSSFELLVSVILSAQTTDDQVNRCAPVLFATYPDARSLADAESEHLESLIKSTGYFRAKAKNIKAAAQYLIEHFDGLVPDSMEQLVLIPGVGRKTAGVILHHIYGKPAIIVDTHFGRVCRRLGFSRYEDPVKLEQDLAVIFNPEDWSDCSMLLNLHGRRICQARKPRCADCFLIDLCPSAIIAP